jgi:SOS regulatory protein LexA
MLTPKQKQVFEYIKKLAKKKGYSPTQKEIGKHFGLVKSTIHQHVETLKEKGYLNDQARAIEIVKDKKSLILVNIPLLGTIAAGQPIEEIEYKETIKVPKSQLAKSGEHFALRVSGNSMINEGIFDGDTVIIRKQPDAENGETVVALLNGNEVTLKKIYKEKNGFRLQPANPNIKPIFTKELTIQGKVIRVIRNFEELKNRGIFKITSQSDYLWRCNRNHEKNS